MNPNILRWSLTGFVVAMLSYFCLLCSGNADASAGGAIIRDDEVPLYSEMSGGSRVLKSLPKGTSVTVDIEIDGPEGKWCGVIEQGQTAVTGYVRCSDLERPMQKERWLHVGSTGTSDSNYGRKRNETKVAIAGNQVLVPVTLGYKGREVDAQLVLDTGASVTMINTDVADRLGIEPAETVKGDGQVVGGMVIQAAFAKLESVSVGPHTRKALIVSIIEEKDLREKRDGLLGMDFLRGLKYYVDFKDQVIKWGP